MKSVQQDPHRLEPIDIYGNWIVGAIDLELPGTDVGIKAEKSRFKIRNGEGKHILEKKENVADVQWNDTDLEIPLEEVENTVHAQANFVLRAVVGLNGKEHELLLGSDDAGTSLKIQVRERGRLGTQPGASAISGRGG